MRKTQLSAFIVAALVLAACEPTPPTAAPLTRDSGICGGDGDGEVRRTCVFDGTWTLNYETTNPANPWHPGESFSCDGTVTVTDHLNEFSFEGTWFMNPDGSCDAISPVSGEVQQGRLRADGGLNFFMEVPPPEGPVKSEDDIWEDVFAGTGVIIQALIAGCNINDADNQMNGALTANSTKLLASASASVTCEEEVILLGDGTVIIVSEEIQLQIRFDGNRVN